MNGATEATLQDLLAVAQSMNANLVGLNRLITRMGSGPAASGGSGGGSSGGVGSLTAAAGPASVALGALRLAGSAVSSVFGVMGTILGKTVAGLTATAGRLWDFAQRAAEGTAKLSDFYNSFRDLPFLIGNVMSIFADIVRYQESMMESYMSMTRAGATFSGSLTVMRDVATRGYLSLEEMSKIVRSNSEVFATLGGNVDNGLRKFIDVQNKLMGPGSQYSRQLLGLGYTSESVAELLGAVYQQQANLNRQDLQNSNRVAEAVASTAKELDLFSRATGKNREELEKELKKKSFDAAWQTFTQGLSAEEAKRAEAAISKAFSIGGQGAADGVKQMFMTGGAVSVPITDAMKQLSVQTGGASDEYVRVMYESARNARLTDQERLEVQLKATRDLGKSYNDFIGPLGPVGGILSMQGNNFVNNMALMNTALKFGTLTNTQISKMAQEAAKNQDAAGKGTAASLAQAQLNIRQFGMTIMNLVNQLVGPIAGYLIQFGEKITSELTPIFNRIVSWFKTTIDELRAAYGDGGGFKGLLKKLGEKIIQGAGNIREFLTPLWETLKPAMMSLYNDYVKPFLSSVFTGIMDFIISSLRKNSRIARFLFSETETEKQEREKIEADPLYRRLLEAEQSRVAAANAATGSEFATGYVDYDAVMAQYKAELARQKAEQQRPATPQVNARERRHSGTLGMTGNWWERENKVVEVQAGETVATQAQIAQIVGAASQNGMSEAVSALNSSIRTLISVSQKIAENTAANVAATKRLDGNVFTMV